MLAKLTNKTTILVLAAILVGAFFRLYQLDQLTTPYWEEVALGYDAYSLLQTGKDHHGNPYPLAAVESFGDWKPSGYFYAAIPFVKAFGLEVLAVRLPAALAGIAIIGLMALLAKKFAVNPVAAAFITALSPWAIIFSRAAWEVNLATALFLAGIVAVLYLQPGKAFASKRNRWLWLIAVITIAASAYSYHALRIIAPLVFTLVVVYKLQQSFKLLRQPEKSWSLKQLLAYGAPLLVVAGLLLPIVMTLNQPNITVRFAQTSIFSDLEVIERSNMLRSINDDSVISRVFYHRYVLFGQIILEKVFQHLSPAFLFFTGDVNPRHSVQYFGQLFHLEAILIFLGVVYFSAKRRLKQTLVLAAWLLIALLPAAMTKTTPHALRSLPAAPIFWLLAAAGITWLLQTVAKAKNSWRWGIIAILILIYSLEAAVFWRFYTKVYPQQFASEWQYGYEQVVKTVQQYRSEQPTAPIYITRQFGRPAMYYWFYSQTNPQLVQLSDSSAPKDQGEFLAFESITFGTTVEDSQQYNLLVLSKEKYQQLALGEDVTIKTEIGIPGSQTGWVIVERQTDE